jgi:hypothetical protein
LGDFIKGNDYLLFLFFLNSHQFEEQLEFLHFLLFGLLLLLFGLLLLLSFARVFLSCLDDTELELCLVQQWTLDVAIAGIAPEGAIAEAESDHMARDLIVLCHMPLHVSRAMHLLAY